jgi:phospholipase C
VPPPGGARNPDPANPPGQQGFLFNRFGVRVPCVLVSPWVRRGLIARPDGYTRFDHTSIIKTVQTCFGLEGPLTERDKAAPDFSCVLTLDTPRRDDLPTVTPLAWNTQAAEASLNDLHRVMGEVAADLTGNPVPNAADVLEFVQQSYASLFGTGGTTRQSQKQT